MLNHFHYAPRGGSSAPQRTFYEAVLALPNLRFYYPMDESSGTAMLDASPNAFHGSYVNAPTLGVAGATSDGATAVTFNGTTQQGQTTDSEAILDIGTSDYSIGMFMKDGTWAAASSFLMARGNGGGPGTGEWDFYQISTTNLFNARVDSVTVNSGNGTKNDDVWHLVGFTADRDGNLQFYRDGAADGSAVSIASESADALSGSGDLYIAARSSGGFASVTLQHAFMCTSALSSGDWAALWAAK